MLVEGSVISVVGKFIVSNIGAEFVELDPFEKGGIEITDKYQTNGFTEITAEGSKKEFDGFQLGDFFALSGDFVVVRSNEVFCKIMVEDQMVSIPLSKAVF